MNTKAKANGNGGNDPGGLVLGVAVPLLQCAICGASVGAGLLAVLWAAGELAQSWRGGLVLAVLVSAGLACWRFGRGLLCQTRLLAVLENATGTDINRDGVIGNRQPARPQVPGGNATIDRLARQMLLLACEGKPISRRALVPKMLTRDEHEIITKRLQARGVCTRNKTGALSLRYPDFATAWGVYCGNADNARSFAVTEDNAGRIAALVSTD
jgi:hypothetical protein